MAKEDNYIGIAMGLDVTDLKAGLQETKKEIQTANKEFSNATAGMDDWKKSSEGLNAKLTQLDKVLEAQKKVVAGYKAELEKTKEQYGENSEQARQLNLKLLDAETQVAKTEKAQRQYTKALESLKEQETLASSNTETLKNRLTELGTKLTEQKSKVDSLEQELDQAKSAYGDNSIEVQKLSDKLSQARKEVTETESTYKKYETRLDEVETETKETSAETGNLKASIDKAGQSAESATNGGFTVLKGALANITSTVIMKATSALKDLASSVVKLGMDFTSSMSEVQAITGASDKDLERLEKTAREFGSTTVFSASESAQALKYMALAGWDTNQSIEALGGVLNLASASGMGLADASDMVTDYLSAFGLEAKDSTKFADMLAYAQSNANTTAEQLGEAYKNSASVMKASGQDVETTTALLASMANQGLKGSQAGTALSAVMRDLTQKMKNGSIQIGDTAVTVMDANGNFRDMTDILIDVENATDGLGTAEKSTALMSTFTSESIKGLNLILNDGATKAQAFEEELRNSDGTAKQMSDTMNNNLSGDIKTLKSALEELGLKIYDHMEQPLRSAITFATENLNTLIPIIGAVGGAFVAWKVASVLGDVVAGLKSAHLAIEAFKASTIATTIVTKAQEVAQIALNTATTLGTALMNSSVVSMISQKVALVASTVATEGATAAQWLMNTAMSAFPLTWILAAIAGVIAAVTLLWENWDQVSQWLNDSWVWLQETAGAVWNAITGFFTDAWQAIQDVWGGVKDFFAGIWNGIKGTFEGAPSWFGGIFGQAFEFIQVAWKVCVKFFQNIWNGIQNTFANVGQFFGNMFGSAHNAVVNAWNNTVGFFQNIWNGIQNAFAGIADWFLQIFRTAKNAITTTWSKVVEFFEGVWSGIYNVFKGVADWFLQIFRTAKNAITTTWSTVTEYFTNIWTAISGAFSGVVTFFTDLFGNAWKNVKDAWDGVGRFFDNIWKNIKGTFTNTAVWFGNTFRDAWNSITGAFANVGSFFNDIWKTITGVFSGVWNWFKDIGADMMGGLIRGVQSMIDRVTNAVRNAVDSAIQGVKDFLGIASPSKLMRDEVGKMMGLGVGEGILASTKDVVKDAVRFTENVTQGIQASALNVGLGASASGVGSGTVGGGITNVTNTYNQTINSPKAPSRIEIYRQTRNLLDYRGM